MTEPDTSKNPPSPTMGAVPAVSSVPTSQITVQNISQPTVDEKIKLQTPWPLIAIIVVAILGGSGWLYAKQFIFAPVSGVVSQGVGTASNPDPDADCNAAYGQGVSDAANELAKEGGSVSQAVFYSPSLKYCVGIISSIKGSVTNTGIFNAETREMLNAGDSATALSDYASPSDEVPTDESINTLPKYGNAVKTTQQLVADETLIQDTIKVAGSREDGAKRAITLGWDFFEKGDLDYAMQRFNQAWLLTPNNADIFWGMGTVEGARGHIDSAITLFSEGLNIDSKHTMLICNLGFAYNNKALDNPQGFAQYLDRAIAQYERANTIDSNIAYCHAMWSVSLFYQQKYREAWQHVYKTRALGDDVEPTFLNDLSAKMPDPFRK